MDEEQRKAFENRISMCNSIGWKDLIEELCEFETVINCIDGVNDIEELYTRKGKMEIIRWIQSLNDRTIEIYDAYNEDKNADI